MSRPLTTELVRARTKSDNLYYVKKFTLCGNDLDDIRILRQMPNLEILSLSVNKISSLREFANCSKLQELYVRNNNIRDLAEVRYLTDLEDLKVLWLCENPCANHPDYRDIVINMLPNLATLDKVTITPEERKAASRLLGEAPQGPGVKRRSPSPQYRENFNDESEESTPREHERREGPSNWAKKRESPPQQYQERYDSNPSRNTDRRGTPGNYARNYEGAPQEYQEVNEFQNYGGEGRIRESYRVRYYIYI